MVLTRKRSVVRRSISIKHTATQPLIEFLFTRGADYRQRQALSKTASLNSRNPVLQPCASCGGSGPMTFNKHFENLFFTIHALIRAKNSRQLVATLVLTVGVVAPPVLVASEPGEPILQPWAQPATLQFRPMSPDEYNLRPSLTRSLERRRLLGIEREAKIQAQTQYLAAKFRRSESSIREYVELAWKEASKRTGMPPELLIAMMQKESSLRPKVQSSYGAQGLMQVVRRWHHDKLHPSESLFDPEVNIRVGADVLAEYLEMAGGSLSKALGKYSGNARGYATKVLNESYKLAHVAAEAASQVVASRG